MEPHHRPDLGVAEAVRQRDDQALETDQDGPAQLEDDVGQLGLVLVGVEESEEVVDPEERNDDSERLRRLQVLPVVLHDGHLDQPNQHHPHHCHHHLGSQLGDDDDHDPEEEEGVGPQQDHDWQLVGVEVYVVVGHEGAGEDGLEGTGVELGKRSTEIIPDNL